MNAHTSRISMWAALSLSVSLLFVILLGVGAPGYASSQQGSTLLLKPSSGPAGTTVQVTGEGFANHCGVNLFLDSTKSAALGFAKVGSPGSFSGQVTILSAAAPGEHTIIAQGLVFAGEFSSCNNPTGAEAPASFTVIEDEFRILFKKRAFTPDPGLNIEEIRKRRNGQPSDRVHFLLQFEMIPNAKSQEQVEGPGS